MCWHLSTYAVDIYTRTLRLPFRDLNHAGHQLRRYTERRGWCECIFIPAHSLAMVGCGESFLNAHDTTHVLKYLWREAFSVVRYELLRRTIAEQPGVHKVLGYFGGWDSFHGYRLGHLVKLGLGDKKVFIIPWRMDKWTRNINTNWRQ